MAALLNPPVRHRPVLQALALAVVLLTCAASLEAARDLHALFELAQAGG